MWKQVKHIIYAACLIDVLNQNFYDLRACIGPSMLPTFNSYGDIALLERLSVRLHKLRQGDIVVASLPHDPDKLICKRLIGLPGDSVCIEPVDPNGCIFATVPPGHVWLQGDNSANSTDSRNYGPVPYGLIRAKVIARVWPLKDIGWISNGFDTFDKAMSSVDTCSG